MDKPFLMPVEDVFGIKGRGTVATGRIERGVVKVGDEVELVGIHAETRKIVVTAVEMFKKLLDTGQAGDNVGCLLRGIERDEIERGQVLAKTGSVKPHTKFVARVYVLTKEEGGRHTPFYNGYRPQFYLRTTDVTGAIGLTEGAEMIMPGDNVDMTVICSLLYAETVVPLGGRTEFADQRAAYDALPEATRRKLQRLVAEHWIATSRRRSGFMEFTEEEQRRLPPVPQVLVRTIPQNGRKSLYVASHAGRIWGMPDAAGRALIDELIAHVTQRQFVYTHRWRPHELVMWDNRCTMHRGTEFDDLRWVRDMRRVTVSDVANSCEQESVPLPA